MILQLFVRKQLLLKETSIGLVPKDEYFDWHRTAACHPMRSAPNEFNIDPGTQVVEIVTVLLEPPMQYCNTLRINHVLECSLLCLDSL